MSFAQALHWVLALALLGAGCDEEELPRDADADAPVDADGDHESAPDTDAEPEEDAEPEADSGAPVASDIDADSEGDASIDAEAPDSSDVLQDAALDGQAVSDDAASSAPDADQPDGQPDGVAPDGAVPPALCPSSGGFTPRPLVQEIFEFAPHLLGQEVPPSAKVVVPVAPNLVPVEWEEGARLMSVHVEGNVLFFTFSVNILATSSYQTIPPQRREGVGIAEWNGSAWHEVFRELHGPEVRSPAFEGGRGMFVSESGSEYSIERSASGGWQSRQLGLDGVTWTAALDGDRLLRVATTNHNWMTPTLFVERRSNNGWDRVQAFPVQTWFVDWFADDGILRIGSGVYRWNGSAYVEDAPLSANPPHACSGGSCAVNDCNDNNAAAGVCAGTGAASAHNAGAVRLFGGGADHRPEGIYFKASNAEAGDGFCRSWLGANMLIVRAGGEDSAAVGLDGDQSSNAAPDSGAHYLFFRDAQGWNQHHYLKLASRITVGSVSSERIAFNYGDRVVLYRYADPPPPSFVYRQPCEGADGQPLPASTICLQRDEPQHMCLRGECGSALDSHETRVYRRNCSGTSLGCDGLAIILPTHYESCALDYRFKCLDDQCHSICI